MDHEPDVHRRDNENGVSEGPFEDVIQIHDNEDPCEDAELDDDYDRERSKRLDRDGRRRRDRSRERRR